MKGIYWLIIIVVLLASGLILVSKYYEPKSDTKKFNVSISAEYNRKLTKTGIEIDGQEINTSSSSYEMIEINEGIIKIKNINLAGQIFYENEIKVNLSSNARIDIILEKPELPTIKVKDNGTILLILESDNFEDVDFCIRGSYNYIFLSAKDFDEIRKLKGFENYDICYDGDFSLNGNKQEIEISYTQFSESDANDYINITVIDNVGNQLTQTIK